MKKVIFLFSFLFVLFGSVDSFAQGTKKRIDSTAVLPMDSLTTFVGLNANGATRRFSKEDVRVFTAAKILKISASLNLAALYPQYKGYQVCENNGSIVTAVIDGLGVPYKVGADMSGYLTSATAASTYATQTEMTNNINYGNMRSDSIIAALTLQNTILRDSISKQTLQNVLRKGNVANLSATFLRVIAHGMGDVVTNVAIGDNSLSANAGGVYNTGVGYTALQANTTGNYNTAFGRCLVNNTTGIANSALGTSALFYHTTGDYNTALGFGSMLKSVSSQSNTAVGAATLRELISGSSNTAVGYTALFNATTSSNNTAVGAYSLEKTTSGTENAAIGASALNANTTGSYNTGFGYYALNANTTGSGNTAVGRYSLAVMTSGENNVGLGNNSLSTLLSGSNNLGIGFNSLSASTGGNENVGIGKNAQVLNPTGSNQVSIANKIYIDTNGNFLLDGVKYYASDAAADADATLPSRAFYKITGSRVLFQKP